MERRNRRQLAKGRAAYALVLALGYLCFGLLAALHQHLGTASETAARLRTSRVAAVPSHSPAVSASVSAESGDCPLCDFMQAPVALAAGLPILWVTLTWLAPALLVLLCRSHPRRGPTRARPRAPPVLA